MFRVIAITVSLAACATAGKGDELPPVDAPATVPDAPRPIDAAVSDCPSTATCAAATMLGSVSGDSGNQKLTAMGYQAAWFRVRVTENNNGAVGLTLRVSAKLTSPASADYDVFVYLNTGSDVVECSTMVGVLSGSGTVNLVKSEWGEGTIPNGSNDGRDVSIEVRPISGTCTANQMWQLEVEGNWL